MFPVLFHFILGLYRIIGESMKTKSSNKSKAKASKDLQAELDKEIQIEDPKDDKQAAEIVTANLKKTKPWDIPLCD